MKETLKIKKVRENAVIPKRATSGSAGIDLYACINEGILLNPGEIVLVPAGIAIALPDPSFGGFVYARSGLASKHGICLANGVGVIDSDYRGEICVPLCNISKNSYTIEPNERIAQLVIMPVSLMNIEEVSNLDETKRGINGFGSTGKA